MTSKKEETRARILQAAGRTFRSHGYGGAGVDGLAKEAGVTSGAFYASFAGKAEAFREAVVSGMRELEAGIRQQQESGGWLERFVDFYLGERRTCDPSESCALQSLTGEVARAGGETRKAYEKELRAVLEAMASGLTGRSATERWRQAVVTLALLSGAVSMARAVDDPRLGAEIAAAVRASLHPAPRKKRARKVR
jgi:TetR/AcrR family transcriptional repressor of nem operon